MKNNWLRIGCFLTGYNFKLIKESSEASAKAVKKYSSALIIISILWSNIGFAFANKYLGMNTFPSIVAALILSTVIIQIEKQIILSSSKNGALFVFRTVIGIVMAILGAVIIDTIIFSVDIENQKQKDFVASRIIEIDDEIERYDRILLQKDEQVSRLLQDISENPTIKYPVAETKKIPGKYTVYEKDVNGNTIEIKKDTVYTETSYSYSTKDNPKMQQVIQLRKEIEDAQQNIADFYIARQNQNIEKEYQELPEEESGFLHELEIMKTIIVNSSEALLFWFLWFLFLIGLELFVLAAKLGERKNEAIDYDYIVEQQRQIHIKRAEYLYNRRQMEPIPT